VKLLADTLRELGSDAEVTIIPGADHSSLLTAKLHRENRLQMSRVFLQHHPIGGELVPAVR